MFSLLKRLFGRRATTNHPDEDIAWFIPPSTMVDAAPWDQYWRDQLAHRPAWYIDMFRNDGKLVDVMRANNLKTVLCVGNGMSQEPRALALAGFDVTVLDLSPFATEMAERIAAVLRQNSIHLRFQQLSLSFSQPKFSRPKFDPSIEGSLITAS